MEHKAAALFPMLEGDELAALVADIKKNGQHMPAYLLDGKLIDGRNRAKACKQLGIDLWTEDLDPKETGDPFVFVMSMNYHRRHLSVLDKGRVKLKVLQRSGGERGKHKGGRPSKNGKLRETPAVSVRALSKTLGEDESVTRGHIKAAEDYEALPELAKAKVDAGEVSVAVAKKVVNKVAPKANGQLPADVIKVFDDEAEKRKKINALVTFVERTASGFTHHSELALKKRWTKADRDIIVRHIDSILKHVKQWKSKI